MNELRGLRGRGGIGIVMDNHVGLPVGGGLGELVMGEHG